MYPVLIRGESGTGKELVASAIQRLSGRRERPFEIAQLRRPPAGAAPQRALRPRARRLHRRRRAGRRACWPWPHGGTLFLDEIGELPLEAQAMLLRFLQDGEVRRRWAPPRRSRVDVRSSRRPTATSRRRWSAGRFREDFYYRLGAAVLEVPPLRERREDIPLLVEHFRRAINQRWGLAVDGIRPQAVARLEGHPWPATSASWRPCSSRR